MSPWAPKVVLASDPRNTQDIPACEKQPICWTAEGGGGGTGSSAYQLRPLGIRHLSLAPEHSQHSQQVYEHTICTNRHMAYHEWPFRIISHTRIFLHHPALSHGVHVRVSSKRLGFRAAYSWTMSTAKGNNTKIPCPTYNAITDVESLENYIPGGYHPIMIGNVLRDRYEVVDKLGFGGYSTVWLAQDTRLERYVAVKIGTVNSPLRETAILRDLSRSASVPSPACEGRSSIPYPLDEFELRGPNGVHPCYTMALAECDLRTVSYSQLFPIDVARALAGGVALAVAYLHARGYAHGGTFEQSVFFLLSITCGI